VVDELWVEIPIDGGWVTIGEQGADELFDELLVLSAGHAASLG
jgi:hypothetical protein